MKRKSGNIYKDLAKMQGMVYRPLVHKGGRKLRHFNICPKCHTVVKKCTCGYPEDNNQLVLS